MKKKIISTSLFLIMLISLVPKSIYAENMPIKIWINGNYVTSDASPIIENERTLVPIRVISENLGYNVTYYPENKSIHIAYLETVNNVETKDYRIFNIFHMTIDNPIVSVSNPKNATLSDKTLEVAPKIINNRTFVPIRFLAEEMGLNIDWESENRTVVIGSGYNKQDINKQYDIPNFDLDNKIANSFRTIYDENNPEHQNLPHSPEIGYNFEYDLLNIVFHDYVNYLEKYYNFPNKLDYLNYIEEQKHMYAENKMSTTTSYEITKSTSYTSYLMDYLINELNNLSFQYVNDN